MKRSKDSIVSSAADRLVRRSFVCLSAGMCAASLMAADVVKNNNTDNLNLGSSWGGGAPPTSVDVGVWNSTVSGANTVSLGADTNWSGIRIANPGGLVTVTAGNTLTLGTPGFGAGIDMSAASQNLVLSNNVVLGALQSWSVASGHVLPLGGALTRSAGAALEFNLPDLSAGGAQVTITNGAANTMLGNTANSSFGNIYFATINDVDLAALDGSFHVVGGSTLGIYSLNTVGGQNPTDNTAHNVADFTTGTPGVGWRFSGAVTWQAAYLNQPQSYTGTGAIFYNGVPAWLITHTSGRNLTVSTVLMTTNLGASALFDNVGAVTVIGNVNTRELFVFQNNPAAPYVMQTILSESGTNTPAFLDKLGAGTMELENQNTYSGGTRVYQGTLRVGALGNESLFTTAVGGAATAQNTSGSLGISTRVPVSAFLGATNSCVVYGGILAQATPNTNTIPITVFGGATNDIILATANTRVVDGTSGQAETIFNSSTNFALTYNSGSHVRFVYGNGVGPSTTIAPLYVTNAYRLNPLTANGTVTVDVLSGSLALGQFPLISYSGTIQGTGGSAFVLGQIEPHAAGYISNNTTAGSIDLVVTNVSQPVHWAIGNGTWDINGTSNWKDNAGNVTTYQQSGPLADNVSFDDSASGSSPITVTLNQSPTPNTVTVTGTKNYTISGSGDIAGSANFTKSGTSTLTLSTANAFTGGLNLNGGILSFSALTNLGAAGVSFGGGTLQYNGNSDDISVRAVTFGTGNGTIDLNGNAVTYANPIGNGGVGGFTLTGANTLRLTGTNRYFGPTFINAGSTLTLQSAGTYISNSSAIVVNGTLDATADATLPVSAPASQILAGTGSVKGEVTLSGTASISPATNGTVGTLTINGDLAVSGGTFPMDIVGPTGSSKDLLAINNTGFGNGSLTLGSGLTAGTILLNITGSPLNNGSYRLITYSGSLNGGAGNLNLNGFNQSGQLAFLSSSASANGEIDLNVITGNTNNDRWVGGVNNNAWDVNSTANWLTNGVLGVYVNGNTVTFDDTGSASPPVNVMATLLPASVTLNVTNKNYTLQDGSGTGSGKLTGNTGLIINGPTLPGVNTTTLLITSGNSGPTVINGSGTTLMIGNGLTNGDIGSGNITNNGTLIFDQIDARIVSGQISGTGKVIQNGSNTLTLAVNNTYAGQTIIGATNGALQIGTGGSVGSVGAGSVTNNGLLAFSRSGNIAAANIAGLGSVSFDGGPTISLGNDTYQGNTTITSGSLKLTANNQIPNGATVSGSTGVLGVGGTLDLAGFNQTVNGLTDLGLGSGLITNSAASGTNTLTVGFPGITNTLTYSGAIKDNTNNSAVQLVVNNPGTTILTGQGSTFRGGIVVGAGTLQLGQGGPNINGGPAAGTGSITMSNGTTLVLGGNNITFVPNNVTIAPNSTITMAEAVVAAGSDTYSGLIFGDALSTNIIQGVLGNNFTFQAGAGQLNGFFGTVLITNGSGLRFEGGSGGTNTTFEVDGTGTIFSRNADTITLGALTGSGSITTPSVTPPATYVIGTKGNDTTFSGIISGLNNIVKSGTGTLTFNGQVLIGTNALDDNFNQFFSTNLSSGLIYNGNTTVSNGVLRLIAPNNVAGGSSNILLAATTAVLDVSQAGYASNQLDPTVVIFPGGATTNDFAVTNGTLTLDPGKTLSGIGTVNGLLVANVGSTVNVGLPTGILTVTTNAQLNGLINMTLNATNTPNASEFVSPGIVIGATATLVVTNAGTNNVIANGTVFQLFNQAVSGFASISLPPTNSLGGAYTWATNLNVNGSIQLVSGGVNPVNTNAFPIRAVSTGSTLALFWPPDRLGFRLQAQTNSATTGIGTNWIDIAGSGAATNATIVVNPANPMVFYRLIYP